MKDTMSKSGPASTKLFFGVIPHFAIVTTNLSQQKENMEARKTAQEEINIIIAENRLFEALIRNISPVAKTNDLKDDVLEYSE